MKYDTVFGAVERQGRLLFDAHTKRSKRQLFVYAREYETALSQRLRPSFFLSIFLTLFFVSSLNDSHYISIYLFISLRVCRCCSHGPTSWLGCLWVSCVLMGLIKIYRFRVVRRTTSYYLFAELLYWAHGNLWTNNNDRARLRCANDRDRILHFELEYLVACERIGRKDVGFVSYMRRCVMNNDMLHKHCSKRCAHISVVGLVYGSDNAMSSTTTTTTKKLKHSRISSLPSRLWALDSYVFNLKYCPKLDNW